VKVRGDEEVGISIVKICGRGDVKIYAIVKIYVRKVGGGVSESDHLRTCMALKMSALDTSILASFAKPSQPPPSPPHTSLPSSSNVIDLAPQTPPLT
jgi:hypothetical protein